MNYGSRCPEILRLMGIVLALTAVGLFPLALAQQATQNAGSELVANLATGRVIIAVVKDAILIGSVENPIEAETRPPTPVQIETSRVGIILGSVDWFSPSSKQEVARLDKELPHLKTTLIAVPPHLGQSQGGDQATDVEAMGQGLFERLAQVAKGLHAKINLPASEPLAELIVADYLGGYGPEVWHLSYGLKQVEERDGYWETRVQKPSYLQFWPVEKGQPRTLIEFNYPPEDAPLTLLQLLRNNDPRLHRLMADRQMAAVADQFIQGDSTKLLAADAMQFLRAALDAITPPNARETMAEIGIERGFAWILPPPPEADVRKQTPSDRAAQKGEDSADAPSLFKH